MRLRNLPFFVYGTLRPDCPLNRPWKYAFLNHALRAEPAILLESSLYFQDWPSLIFKPSSPHVVHGYLVHFSDSDYLEKHVDTDIVESVDSGEYVKSTAWAKLNLNEEERIECYVYHRTGLIEEASSTYLPHGDWVVDYRLTTAVDML